MHFNNKYINLGDSEEEIRDKINYNFSQILSFAIGQEGYIGPKGATGIPGPSGKKGSTGSTGDRATEWTRGNTFPSVLSTQEFDLWVDDSSGVGDVYESGPTANSWSYTGLSLYRSNYFDVYTGIVGPIGVTDKSSTGFKSTFSSNSTSLVFSDTILTSANINPNNSKLLISTEDQATNAIISFIKSNGDTSISPSFRWKNTGSSSYLIFDLPGNLNMTSLFDFSLSSYEPGGGGSFLMTGGGNLTGNTQGGINIISPSNFDHLFLESTSYINIASLNFGMNSSKIYSNVLTEISNFFDSFPYSLASLPTAGSLYNYFGGVRVNSDSQSGRVFDFTGMDGHSVLYGLPSGSVSSGNHKQVVFGETGGGSAGSTGAPYSYHVKRLNNITIPFNTQVAIRYSQRDLIGAIPVTLASNVGDLRDITIWNSNLIVVTPSVSLFDDIYIWVQTPTISGLDPLHYINEGNEYRIYLNEEVSSPTRKIKGIVFTYLFQNPSNGVSSPRPIFLDFPSPCTYVDLSFMSKGSNTNPNPRIFYKTCSGSGGFVSATNFYSISSNAEPNPASAPSTA
jgi:hypothetical protein